MDLDKFVNFEDGKNLVAIFEKIAAAVQETGGIADVLKNAEVAQNLIRSLPPNVSAFRFANLFLAKSKDFQVSEKKPEYHPMISLLTYVLDTDPLQFDLNDRDVQFCTSLIEKSNDKILAIKARSAAGRIESLDGDGIGTGVYLGKRLFLTCAHVFLQAGSNNLQVRFGYYKKKYASDEWNLFELDKNPVVHMNKNSDYAILKIKKDPLRNIVQMFPDTLPSGLGLKARMLHHPEKEPLIISETCEIDQVGEDYFLHTINTDKGSSGAPVFNRQWELIGIHRGVAEVGRSKKEGTCEGVPIHVFRDDIQLIY